MQRLRDDFFAGPVLSGDHDIRVRRADACDRLQHRLHRGRGRNHLRQALGAQETIFRLQPLRSPHCVMKVDLVGKDRKQPRVFPGLLDKVTGAAAHRFDGHFYIRPGGHDDDRQLRIERGDLGEQVKAFLA